MRICQQIQKKMLIISIDFLVEEREVRIIKYTRKILQEHQILQDHQILWHHQILQDHPILI
jgi:hypothetical protein